VRSMRPISNDENPCNRIAISARSRWRRRTDYSGGMVNVA
jgi:hypothetical protein